MESTRSPWYSDIFFWQVTITFKKTWKKSHGISRQSPLIPIKIPYLIAMNPIYNPIFWFIETQKSPPGTWPAGHGCLPELHRAHFAGCPGRSCKWQRGGRISWHFSGINHGIFVAYIYTGWWFGTMEFYDFPFSWECHHPNWWSPSFFRGVGSTTNQYR